MTAPDKKGRLTPKAICEILASHTDHHMVEPKMVYISHPTEIGTLYTKTELEAIARFCKEHNLYLYLDGARLAMGLDAGDISLKTIASTCDAFYIGGTKCGALFGESLVITNATLASDFAYTIKQRGALFAKGRLLGVQFEALMQNNL